ncbi:DUF4179 domain-containing protein [Paenibacillus sp. S-38]|uniref:DUF4179 domain-containing protein n=1 Tax=Paenibacillus sp. S-38 TaxID=3416710 RepID=UPI003CE976D4
MKEDGALEVEQALRRAGEQTQAWALPPEETLHEKIREGIDRAKKEKRVRAARRKGLAWIAASVCLVVVLLGVTVRVSPVLAAALGDLPGLRTFVALVGRTSDQGLQRAVANEFLQPVGAVVEKDGLSFTVDGVLADAGRVVVFYSTRSGSGHKVALSEPEVLDASSGAALQAGYNYGDSYGLEEDRQEEGVQRGTIDIHMSQGVLVPEAIRLRMGLTAMPGASAANTKLTDGEPRKVEVQFGIDRSRFAEQKQELEINRSFEVEGQRVTIVKATVTPLQAEVLLKYEEANTKQIFSPVDMRLTDDEGGEWREIGSTSSGTDGDLIRFESTYFSKPKDLYLEGRMFRALAKEDMSIVVDTNTGELQRAPDDKLAFGGMGREEGGIAKLTFRVQGLAEEDHMVGYNILGQRFQDAQGSEYELVSPVTANAGTVTGMFTGGVQSLFYYLPEASYVQPLTFRVNEYPAYIEGAYRLRIQ